MKKLIALMLITAICFVPTKVLTDKLVDKTAFSLPAFGEIIKGGFARDADHLIFKSLIKLPILQDIATSIENIGDRREYNGVFVSEEQLLVNLKAPDEKKVDANLKAIDSFLLNHNRPTYFTLVPTACAIKQQDVPPLASLYNQRQFISNAYDHFSGRVTSIDAYTALFAAKDQYTYYRTESNLTGLGGYYLYHAMCSRMGLSGRSLNQFEVEHVIHDYYGDIYDMAPYSKVRPDIMTIYHFSRYDRQYMISHADGKSVKRYYSLFPASTRRLGGFDSIIMGGMSAVTDIEIFAPYDQSLLIFADRTVLSYISFLSVHYQRVTVVDLSKADETYLKGLNVSDYDQILFAYSVDTLMHTTDFNALSAIQKDKEAKK